MASPDRAGPFSEGPTLSSDKIQVEVVWVCERASPEGVPTLMRRTLDLAAGSRVRDAVAALGEPELHGGLRQGRLTAAIFGRARSADVVLRSADRVELLGGLLADPKQSRARRALVQRARSGDQRWQRR